MRLMFRVHFQKHSPYRISVTPVLSRILQRHVVKTHIYPALLLPPTQLQFYDQYAFRPTGSTTAALVANFHTICSMLSTNPYVRVFALDFSKAFDTVRHFTLMKKMAHLSLPDEVYNGVLHFLERGRHCTRYNGTISSVSEILASIIQGPALGPATYVVNAAYLRPLNATNEIMKFALSFSLLRGSRPKYVRGNGRQCAQRFANFYQNRFTSGGVIAERVNTIKTHHEVNPILGCFELSICYIFKDSLL